MSGRARTTGAASTAATTVAVVVCVGRNLGATAVDATAAVVAGVGPQRLVDGDPVRLECSDGPADLARAVVHTLDVAGLVVDEPAHLLAEGRVGPGVEDERVPADVHERRGTVAALPVRGAEREEGQRLVHDALREGAIHGLVLDDPADETVPERVADEVLVGQGVADGRLGDGSVDGHAVTSSRLD
jgi:hypothetical protein